MSDIFNLFLRKEEIFLIPSSLKTDVEGFRFFTNLAVNTKRKGKFILDFQYCTWFEANLCAILGAIIKENQLVGASFQISNIESNKYLKNTLENNGFLSIFKNDLKQVRQYSSGIPFADYDMKNESDFEDYIYKYIFSNKNMPQMSEGAKK